MTTAQRAALRALAGSVSVGPVIAGPPETRAFVEAANPATVLSLLDRLDTAERLLGEAVLIADILLSALAMRPGGKFEIKMDEIRTFLAARE